MLPIPIMQHKPGSDARMRRALSGGVPAEAAAGDRYPTDRMEHLDSERKGLAGDPTGPTFEGRD